MRRFTAILTGVLVGVIVNLNPTISEAAPASTPTGVHGTVEYVTSLTHNDCSPSSPNNQIGPWVNVSSGGVVRGAGAVCGEPYYSGEWSAYAWDKASDSGCVAVWYRGHGLTTFEKVHGTEACGNGIVRWQIWGTSGADQVRIVWGNFAASAIIPTPPPF